MPLLLDYVYTKQLNQVKDIKVYRT